MKNIVTWKILGGANTGGNDATGATVVQWLVHLGAAPTNPGSIPGERLFLVCIANEWC